MNNGIEATSEVIGSEGKVAPDKVKVRGGKRLKALLGTAVFLAAALACSLTLSEQGSVETGSSALADNNAALMANRPATDAKVFHQSLPIYHWHQNCPLADATSLRTGTKKAAQKRVAMTRSQAEGKKLMACTYCLDVN